MSSKNKELKKSIKEQIEFYFSDSNVLKDKFILQQIQKDKEGWVDLKLIANFNRVKQLSQNMETIIKSLKHSHIVELNDDKTKLRRKDPLPTEDDSDKRTIYIENLKGTYDHLTIKAQFSKYGKVNLVSLPRYKITKEYKGFGFIEFSTEDELKNALIGINKQEMGEIKGMTKLDWLKKKVEVKQEVEEIKKRKRDTLTTTVDNITFTKNVLVKVNNIPITMTRKEIRDIIEMATPISYIDYLPPKIEDEGKDKDILTFAIIRFPSADCSNKAITYFKSHPQKINDHELLLSQITGDEEKDYWMKVENLRQEAKKRKLNKK